MRSALVLGATGLIGGCLLVSAMGADARSPIFYNRVKGEVEEAVAAVGLPAGLTVYASHEIQRLGAEGKPPGRR